MFAHVVGPGPQFVVEVVGGVVCAGVVGGDAGGAAAADAGLVRDALPVAVAADAVEGFDDVGDLPEELEDFVFACAVEVANVDPDMVRGSVNRGTYANPAGGL